MNANNAAAFSLLAAAKLALSFDRGLFVEFVGAVKRAWQDRAALLAVCDQTVHALYQLPPSWHYEEEQVERAMEAVNAFAEAC